MRSIKVPNTSFNFVNKPSVRLLNAGLSFFRASALLIIYQTTFVVLFVIDLYWPGGSICTSLRGIVRRYLSKVFAVSNYSHGLPFKEKYFALYSHSILIILEGIKTGKVIDFFRICLSHVHQTQVNGCFILSSLVGLYLPETMAVMKLVLLFCLACCIRSVSTVAPAKVVLKSDTLLLL